MKLSLYHEALGKKTFQGDEVQLQEEKSDGWAESPLEFADPETVQFLNREGFFNQEWRPDQAEVIAIQEKFEAELAPKLAERRKREENKAGRFNKKDPAANAGGVGPVRPAVQSVRNVSDGDFGGRRDAPEEQPALQRSGTGLPDEGVVPGRQDEVSERSESTVEFSRVRRSAGKSGNRERTSSR